MWSIPSFVVWPLRSEAARHEEHDVAYSYTQNFYTSRGNAPEAQVLYTFAEGDSARAALVFFYLSERSTECNSSRSNLTPSPEQNICNKERTIAEVHHRPQSCLEVLASAMST